MKILKSFTYKRLFWATLSFGVFASSAVIIRRHMVNLNPQNLAYDIDKSMNSMLRELPGDSTDVMFVGTSLTQFFPVAELYGSKYKNRGIFANTTAYALNRIGYTVSHRPGKLFLEIGINDMLTGVPIDTAFDNIKKCISLIRAYSPKTDLFVQSVTPVCYTYEINNDRIRQLNSLVKSHCASLGVNYIDISSPMLKGNTLDQSLTVDGVHFNEKGYAIWENVIGNYIKSPNAAIASAEKIVVR